MKVLLESGAVIERNGRDELLHDLNGQPLPRLDTASGPVAHLLGAILLELQWLREHVKDKP